MVLLRWCILSPQGPSGLAAILFPSPVKVSSIALFPTGAHPFSQCPDIVATTEPQAFFLDVYFNASLIHPSSQEPQLKNALVPTRIAYAGGQVEFRVDMGSEYATRLVIIQGQYKSLSMAIYGDVVADAQEIREYEPRSIPALNSVSLPKAVDPSNSTEPTMLAQHLLSLLPDTPPLSLIIRLMFCLKPPDEDWDHPDFPYLYSDLDSEDEIYDLATLVQSISRSVKDDVSADTLSTFAEKITDFLGPKSSDDAYYVAKLLSFCAPQRPLISRTLLKTFDLVSIFDEVLDEPTVLCLLDAAANVEIARHFSGDETFLSILKGIQNNSRTEKPLLDAVKKLHARLRGWQLFEDALTNPNGEFMESANFLKDICAEEYSLGCWLECMDSHEDLVAKLGEISILPTPLILPPLLFQPQTHISHQQFIVFVRAVIGIASVLAVWAWADCIDNELDRACRERASSVLALWQGFDGYREILNHCLLLRQLTRRLGWITTENDPPQKAGIIAERLLVGLAKEPQTMLREDLVKTILSLNPPFCFIENEEMLEMRKLASVARDGLSSAIEELAYSSDRPFSLRRLRVLRVSIAVVYQEVDEGDGEWRAIETCWNERDLSLTPRLVAILVDISDDLNQHFVVQSIPQMNQALSELLFRTANDLLHLIARFATTYPLTSWDLRRLATAVVDLFACSERASSNFSKSSMAYLAAQSIRQTCPTILRDLTGPDVVAEPGVLTAQIVLRTLFEHSSQSSGRDPVHHLLQVYDLIDRILSTADVGGSSHWVTLVFPKVLYELESFYRLSDPETKLHLIQKLVLMDNGEIGIGEYLLIKEMENLLTTLLKLEGPIDADEYRLVLQYQVSSSIRFWNSLISLPDLTTWFFSALSTNTDLSQLLNDNLSSILLNSFSSPSLTQFIRELAKHFNKFGSDVRFNILLFKLRIAQTDPSVGDALDFTSEILKSLDQENIKVESLRTEIGRTLSAYAEHVSVITPDAAETLVQILEWLSSQGDSIPKSTTFTGISSYSFSHLCTCIEEIVSAERQISLWDVQTKFSFDDDELFSPSTIELDDYLSQSSSSGMDLSLHDILNLFAANSSQVVPSTPKGTKTPDIFGVVISPPTAILRSSAATGLTKMYVNNDFRQLRQVPSTRLNTSRLPSTHVDEFEHSPPVDSMSTSMLLPQVGCVGTGDVGFQGLLPGNL